jgi:PAS domain S-box-containing protein
LATDGSALGRAPIRATPTLKGQGMFPHTNPTPQTTDEVFRLVADFTFDWEYWRGPNGEYRYCSPSCERITGYPNFAFYEDPELLSHLVLPEDRQVLAEHWRELQRDSGVHTVDFRIRTRSGRHRWIHHICQPVFDAAGACLGRRGTNRDVTEYKEAKQELVRQRDLASAILSTAGALIVVLDRQGRIVRFNEACERTTGYVAEEVEGKPFWDFLLLDGEVQSVKQVFVQVILGQMPSHHENYWLRKDGQRRRIAWSNTCLRDENGDVEYVVGIGIDITDQEQAERERQELMVRMEEDREAIGQLAHDLQQERDLLQVIMDNTQACLAYLDRDFNFVRVNSAYEEQSGHSRAELLGHNHFDLFPNEENQVIFEQVREMGQPAVFRAKPFEYVDQPERGITYWDWSLVPVEGEAGEIEGLVFSLLDVTDMIRMGQERDRLLVENRTQRGFLERLIESAPIGIAVVRGPEHRFELVNPCYVASPGTSCPPAVGLTLAEVYPGLKEDQGASQVDEAYRTGRTVSVRGGRMTALDGEHTYWDVEHVPLKGSDGNVRRVLILTNEVTDEVLARQALYESEEKLRTLVEILPIGVSVLNRQREITLSNPALVESLGLSPEALAERSYEKRKYLRADGTEMPPGEFATVRALAEGRVICDVETGVVKEDGEVVWTSVSAAPFPFSDWIAIATAVDITDRKRLEEALRRTHGELEERVKERTAELVRVAEELREQIAVRARAEKELRLSEERFRQLAENIDEVFWLLEPATGRFVYVSPAYEDLWGQSLEEVYRRSGAFLETVHREDRDRVRAAWKGDGLDFDEEFRVVRPNGTVRWVRVRAFPIRDGEGEVQRVAGIAEDITADKQAQAALIQAEKHAIASRLAASLAHEINNPLQSAMGCLDLGLEALQEGQDPTHYMQVTAGALSQAADVVAHLHKLHQPFRSEAKAPVDLNWVVERTLTLTEKQCQNRRVAVTWDAAPDLPEVPLIPDALEQVFLNLVLNALDAMPEGGQLQVRTARSHLPPGVSIEFTDSGLGIPPDIMNSLFESFVSTKAEGLGLGLFISQNIVQQHGGRIGFESEVGHGTTFTVWLPAA